MLKEATVDPWQNPWLGLLRSRWSRWSRRRYMQPGSRMLRRRHQLLSRSRGNLNHLRREHLHMLIKTKALLKLHPSKLMALILFKLAPTSQWINLATINRLKFRLATKKPTPTSSKLKSLQHPSSETPWAKQQQLIVDWTRIGDSAGRASCREVLKTCWEGIGTQRWSNGSRLEPQTT